MELWAHDTTDGPCLCRLKSTHVTGPRPVLSVCHANQDPFTMSTEHEKSLAVHYYSTVFNFEISNSTTLQVTVTSFLFYPTAGHDERRGWLTYPTLHALYCSAVLPIGKGPTVHRIIGVS